MKIDFTEVELRRFAPKMADFYRRALLDGKEHLADAGILDNGKRLSHFMGQVGAETGGGTIVRESLTYTTVKRIREVWPARARKSTETELKALVRNPVALGDWAYGGREGNRKGTTDGYDFRGGGFLQTTHRNNVEAYCKKLGIEIRPDILDDPEVTLRFACTEWIESRCNKLADANDLMGISKAINTGSATSSVVPNGMEHRAAWLKKAQTIWWDAEPVEASEAAETVPASLKSTVPPPSPVKAAAASSWTVFGGLMAFIAWLMQQFEVAIQVAMEAVAELTKFDAIKTLTSGTSIKIAAATLSLVAIGIVVGRRLHAAHTGKTG